MVVDRTGNNVPTVSNVALIRKRSTGIALIVMRSSTAGLPLSVVPALLQPLTNNATTTTCHPDCQRRIMICLPIHSVQR